MVTMWVSRPSWSASSAAVWNLRWKGTFRRVQKFFNVSLVLLDIVCRDRLGNLAEELHERRPRDELLGGSLIPPDIPQRGERREQGERG